MADTVSSADAAKRLGVSRRRIIAMIAAEQIKAQPFGNTYAIPVSEIQRIERDRPKAGRPKGSTRKGKSK